MLVTLSLCLTTNVLLVSKKQTGAAPLTRSGQGPNYERSLPSVDLHKMDFVIPVVFFVLLPFWINIF